MEHSAILWKDGYHGAWGQYGTTIIARIWSCCSFLNTLGIRDHGGLTLGISSSPVRYSGKPGSNGLVTGCEKETSKGSEWMVWNHSVRKSVRCLLDCFVCWFCKRNRASAVMRWASFRVVKWVNKLQFRCLVACIWPALNGSDHCFPVCLKTPKDKFWNWASMHPWGDKARHLTRPHLVP